MHRNTPYVAHTRNTRAMFTSVYLARIHNLIRHLRLAPTESNPRRLFHEWGMRWYALICEIPLQGTQ